MGQLAKIALSEIRENKVALRTVNTESEEFLGLVDSMKEKGFFGAITVRKCVDAATGIDYYQLIDGLHRFTAAGRAGLKEINVDIVDFNDDQVLEAQIMANIHKIETKPVEYTSQLKRILTRNPNMTELELAQKLGKSAQWISDRLSLSKIDNPTIKALIDEGKIVLSNAYALAKLPPEEMSDFVDRAMTQAPDEFVPAINRRVKEIKEARRKGGDAAPIEFEPVAHMQKMRAVKDELETLETLRVLISKQGITDPLESAKLTLLWLLHLDPDSVAEQKRKDDQRKAEKEAAKKKKEEERAAKRQAAANSEAASAAVEASETVNA